MRQRLLHREKTGKIHSFLAERPVDDERRDEEALARCGAASRGDFQDASLFRPVAHQARRRWALEHDTHGSQHSDTYARLRVVCCERLLRRAFARRLARHDGAPHRLVPALKEPKLKLCAPAALFGSGRAGTRTRILMADSDAPSAAARTPSPLRHNPAHPRKACGGHVVRRGAAAAAAHAAASPLVSAALVRACAGVHPVRACTSSCPRKACPRRFGCLV
eukprot:scaffold2169_cov72-Phaeocystis_antarctica.AAC.3